MAKFFDINAGKSATTEKSEEKMDSKDKDMKKAEPLSEPLDVQLRESFVEGKSSKKEKEDIMVKEDKPKETVKESSEHDFEDKVEEKSESNDEKKDEVLAQAPDIPRATADMAPKTPPRKADASPSSFVPPTSTKQRIVTSILGVVLIVLLALLVSQALIFFKQSRTTDSTASQTSATTNPTVEKKTSEATPPATTDTPAVTTDTTAASPISTALTKEKATVRVLNGSGVTGAASKVTTALKAAGYTVSGTGNAKAYTYLSSEIYYKNTDGKAVADDIAKTLSTYTTSVKEDADTVGSASDILVIVGKK